MKWQALFSLKNNNKKYFNMLSAAAEIGTLMVNDTNTVLV